MKIKRIEHVAMAVNDLKAFTGVLRDKLGLTLEYTETFPQYQTKMAMFPVGETSYVRKLATELSGGVFGYLDSVLNGTPSTSSAELI